MFDEDSNQKTVFNTVALDIVHDLIHGKNGLYSVQNFIICDFSNHCKGALTAFYKKFDKFILISVSTNRLSGCSTTDK